ncbi:general secretion pathway protein GspK [Pseudomonas sp. TH41]|uniref:type II secretion system protein GspK n=1 Tax=Pseudomonas sp. TH41 TaxID=2796405 RepID=UPI0019129CCF|nr:type II secretion system protein GspK [Pseudomonas sp. TH41]MBK5352953.1 general secretion pathway protein GspK [Pseudomonas sp. TH41]
MNGRQRGIALISVLLVMSLALLITSGLLRSHRLSLQSSGQALQQIHLRQLGVAGETWALLRLQDAALDAQKTVDLTQAWATPRDYDIEDTQVRVAIEDLSGRFNLNSLLIPGQIDQITLNRWSRLLDVLDLPPLQLRQVGALRELSQLRLLPGVDGQWLRQLEPWVALLPSNATLNINTAPALVLRTLDGVEATTAGALARQALTTGWASVQAFTQDPLISGVGLNSHGLGTRSRWFRITVEVTQGQSRLRLATDVERDPDTHRFNILQRRLLPSKAHEMPR